MVWLPAGLALLSQVAVKCHRSDLPVALARGCSAPVSSVTRGAQEQSIISLLGSDLAPEPREKRLRGCQQSWAGTKLSRLRALPGWERSAWACEELGPGCGGQPG